MKSFNLIPYFEEYDISNFKIFDWECRYVEKDYKKVAEEFFVQMMHEVRTTVCNLAYGCSNPEDTDMYLGELLKKYSEIYDFLEIRRLMDPDVAHNISEEERDYLSKCYGDIEYIYGDELNMMEAIRCWAWGQYRKAKSIYESR